MGTDGLLRSKEGKGLYSTASRSHSYDWNHAPGSPAYITSVCFGSPRQCLLLELSKHLTACHATLLLRMAPGFMASFSSTGRPLLAPPQNVTLLSRDFSAHLTWLPGPGNPQNVTYFVAYQRWKDASELVGSGGGSGPDEVGRGQRDFSAINSYIQCGQHPLVL